MLAFTSLPSTVSHAKLRGAIARGLAGLPGLRNIADP
jgi:hypothetical protein